jgi:hypothetical protein
MSGCHHLTEVGTVELMERATLADGLPVHLDARHRSLGSIG